MKCYHHDECDGATRAGGYYQCGPNMSQLVGIVGGGIMFVLAGILFCIMCPCCIVAKAMKRRQSSKFHNCIIV